MFDNRTLGQRLTDEARAKEIAKAISERNERTQSSRNKPGGSGGGHGCGCLLLIILAAVLLGKWIEVAQPSFTALNAERTEVNLTVSADGWNGGWSKKITNWFSDRSSETPIAPKFNRPKGRTFEVLLADGEVYPSTSLPANRFLEDRRVWLYYTIQVRTTRGPSMKVKVFIDLEEAAAVHRAASQKVSPPQLQAEDHDPRVINTMK